VAQRNKLDGNREVILEKLRVDAVFLFNSHPHPGGSFISSGVPQQVPGHAGCDVARCDLQSPLIGLDFQYTELESDMKFEEWLQGRLTVHGSRIVVDGDWGRSSIKALKAFQAAHGLPKTGVADDASIKALRSQPESKGPTSEVSSQPAETMPPWMSELHRRMGMDEVKDNAALIDFLRIGRYLGNPKDLPWCGDAVESSIAKTLPDEPLPGNPFFAQNWKSFGIDAGSPIVGSIGVIRWDAKSGHVGMVAGVAGDRINMLGGNQHNSINISSFPLSKYIAFRWPSTYPMRKYPALKGTAFNGSWTGTR
jgi:uncharacterized protein (TIGR02594 family)